MFPLSNECSFVVVLVMWTLRERAILKLHNMGTLLFKCSQNILRR